MQDITIGAFWAMAGEMLGAAFWPLVLLIAVLALLDFVGLVRGPKRVGRRSWLLALGIGAAAGIAAMLAAPGITQSSLAQVVTFTDWLFLVALGLGVALAVGLALVALLSLRRATEA